LPVALEHAVQVSPERLGESQDDQEEASDLQPTVRSHALT
jgi:hypothetical protein